MPFLYVIIIVILSDPFDVLLNRYRGLLFTLCRRYSRHGTTVEDLLQESSVALWRDRERLVSLSKGPQQAALVWKIARNAIIDALRRTPLHEQLPEGYDRVDEEHTMRNELREQIMRLGEPDTSIVKMQLEGYSYEEIGNYLGMSEKNVSVRLVRAREKLRRLMVDKG